MPPLRAMIGIVALLCAVGAGSAAEERLVFRGSVAVKPLVDAAATAYAARSPGLAFASSGCTSDESLQAVISGQAQLGALAKELTSDQRRQHPDLRTIPIAIDGLVLVVDADNPLNGLNSRQVGDIFTGAVATWKALGGAATPIIPVVRTTTYASAAFFNAVFTLESREEGEAAGRRMRFRRADDPDWGPAAAMVTADHAMGLETVQRSHGAITYAPYGIAQAMIANGARLKLLALDGTAPTPSTIKSAAYPATRPCLLLLHGEPQGALLGFVAFLTSSEGQKLVEACDFVPLAK